MSVFFIFYFDAISISVRKWIDGLFDVLVCILDVCVCAYGCDVCVHMDVKEYYLVMY